MHLSLLSLWSNCLIPALFVFYPDISFCVRPSQFWQAAGGQVRLWMFHFGAIRNDCGEYRCCVTPSFYFGLVLPFSRSQSFSFSSSYCSFLNPLILVSPVFIFIWWSYIFPLHSSPVNPFPLINSILSFSSIFAMHLKYCKNIGTFSPNNFLWKMFKVSHLFTWIFLLNVSSFKPSLLSRLRIAGLSWCEMDEC